MKRVPKPAAQKARRAKTTAPRPRILLTNDDGIVSEGLRALERELARFAEVVVVAPDREQSAVSHALTIRRPLRATEIAPGRFAVDGTPTDCVNLGMLHVCRDRPLDLVVSGINFGFNLGDDVTYSGTVSAAFEASLRGVPSIAVSQGLGPNLTFRPAARFVARLAEGMAAARVARDEPWILNVNVPAGRPTRAEVTRLGKRELHASVFEKVDPRGERYFWMGQVAPGRPDPGTDFSAAERGVISVTPLHLDLTSYTDLGAVRDLVRRCRARVELPDAAHRRR